MGVRDLIQYLGDTWASLTYKKDMETQNSRLVKPWVGTHWRRVTAYQMLAAIYQNRSRAFLNVGNDETADVIRRKHREYGDAALIVNVVRSAVTGDDISVVIEDMEEGDAQGEERLAWLEAWSTTERLPAKVLETERDTAKLGDGVYVVTGDVAKGRPHLRLYDPGFYFPALDPNAAEDEYPKVVHVAWEYEETTERGETVQWVRRITWELAETPPGVVYRHPWNDEPSMVTCYMTDGHWRVEDLQRRAGEGQVTIDNWRAWPKASRYERDPMTGQEVNALDIQRDYIPVVHLPNTVSIKEHYGESILLAIAQALDELATADTDAASAAALAGLPMIGVEEGNVADIEVAPGKTIPGKFTPLDLSASLNNIMAYIERMLDRITVNARLTSEALGRVNASDVPSGIALALSFGPMRSLVEELRLVRAEKYPILLRFVQREAMAHGWIDGPIQPATLAFGSFLPSDKAATIEAVSNLYTAHLISRHTAIKWLVDEGIIDVDVAAEVEACEHEDHAAAVALLDAFDGDQGAKELVAKFLGVELPESTEPETNGQATGNVAINPQTGNPVLALNGPGNQPVQ